MRTYRQAICLSILVTSCNGGGGGKASSPVAPNLKPGPQFEHVSDELGFDLPLDSAFSFPIRTVGTYSDLRFQASCTPACPSGVKVSESGQFSWDPNTDSKEEFFSLNVSAQSEDSAASQMTINFRIVSSANRIGPEWNRYTSAELSTEQYVQMTRKFIGTDLSDGLPYGTVNYLGAYEEKHFVLSAAHVFEKFMDSAGKPKCDAKRIFVFKEANFAMSCVKVAFRSDKSDYAIYEVKPIESSKLNGSFSDLTLPMFASRIPEAGKKLSAAGFGSFLNPYADLSYGNSESCVSYLTTPFESEGQRIVGMKEGKVVRENYLRTLLTAPCEGSDGDSGGPVIVQESSEVVGITVGGFRAKVSDEDALNGLRLNEDERAKFGKLIYVPSSLVFEEIKAFASVEGEYSPAMNAWLSRQFKQ